MTKLNVLEVMDIKQRLLDGEDYHSIAKDFPVNWENIKCIDRGRTWTKVSFDMGARYTPQWTHFTNEKAAEVTQDIKDGMTVVDAGIKYGCAPSTIGRLFKRVAGMSVRSYKAKANG